MSFVAVEELLRSFRNSHQKFHGWVEQQERKASDVGFRAYLTRLESGARIQLDTMDHHLKNAPDGVLRTQLQFDGGRRVGRLVEALPDNGGETAAEVMEHVASYYDTLVKALKQAADDAESTPAADVLRDWATDTETRARNDAWFGRDTH